MAFRQSGVRRSRRFQKTSCTELPARASWGPAGQALGKGLLRYHRLDAKTLLLGIVEEENVCPITQEALKDSVLTMDGHAYESQAISHWLQDHNTSPSTGLPLSSKYVIPMQLLKQMLEECMLTVHSDLNRHLLKEPSQRRRALELEIRHLREQRLSLKTLQAAHDRDVRELREQKRTLEIHQMESRHEMRQLNESKAFLEQQLQTYELENRQFKEQESCFKNRQREFDLEKEEEFVFQEGQMARELEIRHLREQKDSWERSQNQLHEEIQHLMELNASLKSRHMADEFKMRQWKEKEASFQALEDEISHVKKQNASLKCLLAECGEEAFATAARLTKCLCQEKEVREAQDLQIRELKAGNASSYLSSHEQRSGRKAMDVTREVQELRALLSQEVKRRASLEHEILEIKAKQEKDWLMAVGEVENLESRFSKERDIVKQQQLEINALKATAQALQEEQSLHISKSNDRVLKDFEEVVGFDVEVAHRIQISQKRKIDELKANEQAAQQAHEEHLSKLALRHQKHQAQAIADVTRSFELKIDEWKAKERSVREECERLVHEFYSEMTKIEVAQIASQQDIREEYEREILRLNQRHEEERAQADAHAEMKLTHFCEDHEHEVDELKAKHRKICEELKEHIALAEQDPYYCWHTVY